MSGDIKVTVEGSDKIDARLTAYGTTLRDFAPFLRLELVQLIVTTKERFDSEGGDFGGWEPLDPKYVRWKVAKYGNSAIGVMSGRMRASLIYGGQGAVTDVSSHELVYGTKVQDEKSGSYPNRFHKYRPLLGTTDVYRHAMAERLTMYMKRAVEGAS